MENTAQSLMNLADMLDDNGIDTGSVAITMHTVPAKYIKNFTNSPGLISHEWKAAYHDNVWLDLEFPGLEVTVWFN